MEPIAEHFVRAFLRPVVGHAVPSVQLLLENAAEVTAKDRLRSLRPLNQVHLTAILRRFVVDRRAVFVELSSPSVIRLFWLHDHGYTVDGKPLLRYLPSTAV